MARTKSCQFNGIRNQAVIQTWIYNGKKMASNWEKHVSHNTKYHIILENFKDHGFKGKDLGGKFHQWVPMQQDVNISVRLASGTLETTKYWSHF